MEILHTKKLCKLKPMTLNCFLPNDLVYDHILPRFLVRDLLRSRCVCKDWRALIDNPSFIRHHYQVQTSIISNVEGNISQFVDDMRSSCNGDFYLLSMHQKHETSNADFERDCLSKLPFYGDQCRYSCYGCVNGVILFRFRFEQHPEHNHLGLWNYSTREFKCVIYPFAPGFSSDLVVGGFGFDKVSNDFKILGTYHIVSEGVDYHEIYSLRTNSWKRLALPPASDLQFSSTDGYLNGVQYWIGYQEHQNGIKWVIVSFDFTSEIYTVSDFPEDAKPLLPMTSVISITLYKESIGLFMSQEVQGTSLFYKVDVWVVTRFDNCGVALSWQPWLTIGPTATKFYLMAGTTRKDGDLVLIYMYMTSDNCYDYLDGEEYLYNPSESKYFKDGVWKYCLYTGSLFPLSNRFIQS